MFGFQYSLENPLKRPKCFQTQRVERIISFARKFYCNHYCYILKKQKKGEIKDNKQND